MLGFAILLGFYLLGSLLQAALHLPFPGNVIGLILFLFVLAAGWVKSEWVEREADWLLKHMMLFFAPIIVGVEVYGHYFQAHLLTLGASWLFSTLAAMLAAGWTVKLLRRKGDTHE